MAKSLQEITNEESRVNVYFGSGEPTNSDMVTSETKLGELNLNWREKELPQKIRTKHVHGLHPYLGKFIPQLVEVFLRKYFKPGMTVLDPFAGSGTTLVQANELGINSIGYDISAFNVLLMQAKTQKYNLKEVTREIHTILHETKKLTSPLKQMSLIDVDAVNITNNNEYVSQWFAPQARKELLVFRKLLKKYKNQDILKVILTRSARSARLTTHFDLDFPKKPQTKPYWCYKHSRICKPTTTAFKFLKRYGHDTIRRLKEFDSRRTNASIHIIHDDVQTAEMPRVDGVITSPPYVGLIDYHDQHRYAYELLGLEDKSSLEIGAARDGISQKARQMYQQSLVNVLKRLANLVPMGGRLIVIAGDKHNLYDEIARLCGFTIEAILQRHVNRRTGRRASKFYESVFIWRKT
jgi:DNA modification methylase